MVQLAAQFLESLQRSRILTPAQEKALRACSDGYGEEGPDPQRLAEQLVADQWLTRFQVDKLLMGRGRELRVSDYILTDLIGVGGMGSVYSAIDPVTRQPVALKVLSADFKADAGMRTRFLMEAHAGMGVDHPNLIRTLAHGTTDDVFGEMDYVVMELFQGIALHELTSVHGALHWSMASDMVLQAAQALQVLHERGLIHRDVKPDNLLVDETGQVKLVDYGLALSEDAVRDGKVQESGEEFTLTMLFGHDCLGTPDYMAPEQAQNSLAADVRSDVYALGCSLYTLLAGKRPYHATSKAQLIETHRTAEIPRIRASNPKVPPELENVLVRMMAKSPADRPANMLEVIAALQPFAVRRPVRFKYGDLLRARKRLADQKSTLSRKSSPSRSTSSVRAAVLASYLETGVSSETSVAGKTNAGQKGLSRTGVSNSQGDSTVSAAEMAQKAFAAYNADPTTTAPPLARLQFLNGDIVPLRSMHVTIGRGADNDLVLNSSDLSTRHCSLTFDGDSWILRDFESRNGVRLNGHRIRESVVPLGGLITLANSTNFRLLPGIDRQLSTGKKIAIAAGAAAILIGIAWLIWSLM